MRKAIAILSFLLLSGCYTLEAMNPGNWIPMGKGEEETASGETATEEGAGAEQSSEESDSWLSWTPWGDDKKEASAAESGTETEAAESAGSEEPSSNSGSWLSWGGKKDGEAKGMEKPDADELGELGDSGISVQELWSRSIGQGSNDDRVKLVPYVLNDKVFVADRDGDVQALSAVNGKTLWETETDLSISGGPGAGEGLVLVGTSDGEILALDEETGKERWRARVSSEVLSVPKAAQEVVVVTTIDGKLFAFSTTNGKLLWIYDRTVPVLSLHGSGSPVISGSTVVAGFASGKLAAFELATGNPLWESTISIPSGRSELERMVDIDGDPVVMDGIVYVATFQGDLAAVIEVDGEVMWRKSLSSYAGLGADWRQLYITDAEDNVWAIDPRNGGSLWKQDKMKGKKLTAPVILDSYVIVGDGEGNLYWLSPEDGQVLGSMEVLDDPISTPPMVVDGVAYVLSDDGDLVAISHSK